jgi:hypothetical protein
VSLCLCLVPTQITIRVSPANHAPRSPSSQTRYTAEHKGDEYPAGLVWITPRRPPGTSSPMLIHIPSLMARSVPAPSLAGSWTTLSPSPSSSWAERQTSARSMRFRGRPRRRARAVAQRDCRVPRRRTRGPCARAPLSVESLAIMGPEWSVITRALRERVVKRRRGETQYTRMKYS